MMLEIKTFGHLNIVVPNLDEAQEYYQRLFGTEPLMTFKQWRNEGLTKNLGFEEVEISLATLKFSHCNLVLELMEFHQPKGDLEIKKQNLNDLGGPRHVSLQVEDVQKAFDALKNRADVQILNDSNFRPVFLSPVTQNQFVLGFEDENLETKNQIIQHFCEKQFFYFRDAYGVIWEIEERVFERTL